MNESLKIFTEEANDLLLVAEQALLNLDDLEQAEGVEDCVNDLFRTFHTIKGAAGLFGLDSIVDFTHIVESVLGKIRLGEINVDDDLISLFLASRDELESMVNRVEQAGQTDVQVSVNSELLNKLGLFVNDKPGSANIEPPLAEENEIPEFSDDGETIKNDFWHISLRFGKDCLKDGMDPNSFISYLEKLGQLESVVIVEDILPEWNEYDPESCYLGFEILFSSENVGKIQLEEVFEFVQDDSKISILPPHSKINDYIKLIEALPEERFRIGEILVVCGALTQLELDKIIRMQSDIIDEVTSGNAESVPQFGSLAVNQKVIQKEVVDAALLKQEKAGNAVPASDTVRVSAERLDKLVNLVGELVITSANSDLCAKTWGNPTLIENIENLMALVQSVRDSTLGLRMVQIGETFNRFKRVVRETSKALGKEIDLQLDGVETELDKRLIEKIVDPLTHLVRNAIDHGIETPEERIARGKPAKGIVRLKASHESGSILIQIADNGKGLRRDMILKKAREKGLLEANQDPGDLEVFNLVFEPGFSTADSLSNLSGRGVGMDVVRKNIEALKGKVDIQSKENSGTLISIRLPLTLAIIDGFLVGVDDSRYVIPLDMVEECIELHDALKGGDRNSSYINLRGEILPIVKLGEVFGGISELRDDKYDMHKHRDNLLVVRFGHEKVGLLVDSLHGEHQTVIKPLGRLFDNVKGISGATIMGDGEVALIIDVPEMITYFKVNNRDVANTTGAMH